MVLLYWVCPAHHPTHQLLQVVQLPICLVQEGLKVALLLQQQLSLPVGVRIAQHVAFIAQHVGQTALMQLFGMHSLSLSILQ